MHLKKSTSKIKSIVLMIVTVISVSCSTPIAGSVPYEIWELVENPFSLTSAEFRDVKFINASHGWVVGKNGTGLYGGIVLHTQNGGQSWILQLYNSTQFFRQIAIIDEKNIWVTGLGGLFYSLDGGQTWNESVVIDENSGMSTVAFINSTHGWTAAMGTLYQTIDGGLNWQVVAGWTFSDDHPRKIQFLTPMEAWAIGYNGIYHSTDGCVTWEQKYNRGGWALSVVDNQEGWAVDDDMLAHMDDGETWTELPPPRITPFTIPTVPYFSDVLFIDKKSGWIVGSETAVLHTQNGGLDWYEQSSQIEPIGRLMSVDFINETHGWAVGHDGHIIRTTHGNSVGTRLWLGLTDPIFLSYVAATAGVGVLLAILLIRYLKRRKSHQLIALASDSHGIE